MEYHAIVHFNTCTVRPKTEGINDTEWRHGCRIFVAPCVSQYQLHLLLERETEYDILDQDNWRQYITDLDPTEDRVQEDYFKKVYSRFKAYDKWDSIPTIY